MEYRKVMGLLTGLLLFIGGLVMSPVTDPVSCFDVLWTVEGAGCVDGDAFESGLFLFVAVVGAVLSSLMLVDILHSSIEMDGESRMIDPAFVKNKDSGVGNGSVGNSRGLEGPSRDDELADPECEDKDAYDVRLSGSDIASAEKERLDGGDDESE